jgi:cullin-associated NEDD8-dissociated protein 1
MNVLEGEDQLCQRMSWALYEHLNVGITTAPDNTETNLYSYDIMTRNCFGSYFDILKEMTYNPKIGEQFNSVGSQASRQPWDASGLLVHPDENLGREIMQLFTVPELTNLEDPPRLTTTAILWPTREFSRGLCTRLVEAMLKSSLDHRSHAWSQCV